MRERHSTMEGNDIGMNRKKPGIWANLDHILDSNALYIVLIVLCVILFVVQINLPPCERYPGWDEFWIDVRQSGKLYSLRYALAEGELPYIDPYTGFGWNLVGDHHSFWSPINLFVTVFSPSTVMVLARIGVLLLGGIGGFLYLLLLTNNRFTSFLGGLAYVTTPFVLSLMFPITFGFYFVPLMLVLIHRLLDHMSTKRLVLFVFFCAIAVAACDIYFLPVLFAVSFLYTFVIANWYCRSGFIASLKIAFALLLLSALSGAFYIVPLYSNLRAISAALRPFRTLNLYPMGAGRVDFLWFFRQYGFESLYKPLEGSALLLYIPSAFYVSIIIGLLFNKVVFKDKRRQVAVLACLVFLGTVMFLGSVAFYSPLFFKIFPSLVEGARGVLRVHINLIPFVNLLAGFLCFAAISNIRSKRVRIGLYALVVAGSLSTDLLLFGSCRVSDRPFASSNIIHIYFRNTWDALPWLNITYVFLLMSHTLLQRWRKDGTKRFIQGSFILSAFVLTLVNVSVYNELLVQSSPRSLTRNPYRWANYLYRKECIDEKIDRTDLNYRVLYAGEGKVVSSSGRDWRLIAETELHTWDREKALFSYREFTHPYTGLLRGTFHPEGGFYRSNIFPPLSAEVEHNMNTIRLMGVKYVVSAGEKIEAQDLVLRGECRSNHGPPGIYKEGNRWDIYYSEGGPIYIYEMVNPMGIAFLVDKYVKVGLGDALLVLYENKQHPWEHNLVLLEADPVDNYEQGDEGLGDAVYGLESEAQITRETYNTIEIKASSPEEAYLVLSYIYKPDWKAYIDSSEVPIYRAYGGFMCVQVPAGVHTITFKYYPVDSYVGFGITAVGFLIPFCISIVRRAARKNIRQGCSF